MQKRKIIAILGLPGAGKSEAINYLVKKCGWPKVYMGAPTFDNLKRLGLPFTEKNEKMSRESLRKKYGIDYYGREAIQKIKLFKKEKRIVVESLYSWKEYLLFKKTFGLNFIAVAVCASPKIRHKRSMIRKERAMKNEKETWSRDYSQIENLEQGGPIAMADFTIVNEGTFGELRKNIDKVINKLK
jgi:dephospho-CoA kinase